MTFKVIVHFIKNMRLHIVSIHKFFYYNRFINECVRKNKAKISEFRSPGVTESRNHGFTGSRSFLVRYRRTYVLKNQVFTTLPHSLTHSHLPSPLKPQLFTSLKNLHISTYMISPRYTL